MSSWRIDTRRRSDADELIGEKNGSTYYGPGGRWYKRRHSKAQRRAARELILAELEEREPHLRRSVFRTASEVNWKGS